MVVDLQIVNKRNLCVQEIPWSLLFVIKILHNEIIVVMESNTGNLNMISVVKFSLCTGLVRGGRQYDNAIAWAINEKC